MTATLETCGGQPFDWRSKSACCTDDYDSHFRTVQDFIEEGLSEGDAISAGRAAEAEAKAICNACPVRAQCRDEALREENGELGHGIWGGLNPAERRAYRPTWLRIKKLQGLGTVPTVQKDQDALHPEPGVNARRKVRLKRITECRDRLVLRPDWALASPKYGTHPYAECMHLLELIVANPTMKDKDLARGIGKSQGWFSNIVSEICVAMGV